MLVVLDVQFCVCNTVVLCCCLCEITQVEEEFQQRIEQVKMMMNPVYGGDSSVTVEELETVDDEGTTKGAEESLHYKLVQPCSEVQLGGDGPRPS